MRATCVYQFPVQIELVVYDLRLFITRENNIRTGCGWHGIVSSSGEMRTNYGFLKSVKYLPAERKPVSRAKLHRNRYVHRMGCNAHGFIGGVIVRVLKCDFFFKGNFVEDSNLTVRICSQ